MLSRENVFNVLGLETGGGGGKMDQKWIKNGSKEWREMSKKRTKKRSQQHPVFPGGHPSKY